MRVLTEPKVYLLARPQIHYFGGEDCNESPGLDNFLYDNDLTWPTRRDDATAAEVMVEAAGRMCYMSFGDKAVSKSNHQYIQNILGRKPDGTFREGPAHGSVVEHPTWSFIVSGAGRGFSHEQVRHRVGWAYSQLSTRYCDFEREEQEGTWDRERNRMLRKAARGAARDILPIATEAIMVLSANARAIWNCIFLRGSRHAEAAIRSVYVQLARIMEREMPALFFGIQYNTLWDGSTEVIMPREKI
jgi:thymidylate synthase (FAD)